MGLRGNVARNILANANGTRDWRIYCDFAQSLIGIARRLYAEEPLGMIRSLTMFERTPLRQLLTLSAPEPLAVTSVNQLNLFK